MKVRSGFIDRFLAVSICLFFLTVAAPSYGLTVDKVLATVDEEAITLSDYVFFAKTLDSAAAREPVDERVLRKLIEEIVILHEARRRGVQTSDPEVDKVIEEVRNESGLSREEFEKKLAREGMSLERYRGATKRNMTVLKLMETDVNSKVVVAEGEIEKAYRANKTDYLVSPSIAEVKAIFIKLEEGSTVTEITDLKRKASRISAQLKSGGDFEAMAQRYSDEPLKSKKGELGEFKRGALIPELDKKIFAMNPGETSDPIWVKEGVYIVKLVSRTEDGFKSLEEARQEIRRHLYSQHSEKIYSDWMKVLWEKASITIN